MLQAHVARSLARIGAYVREPSSALAVHGTEPMRVLSAVLFVAASLVTGCAAESSG